MSSSTPSRPKAPNQAMLAISPFVSPGLLRRLSNSTVDKAEDVLSELRERGYLLIEGDSRWKIDVLMAIITRASTFTVVALLKSFRLTFLIESTYGEADSVRVEITSARENPTVDEVPSDIPTGPGGTIFLCVQNDDLGLHHASSSANISPYTSAITTSRGDEGIEGPSSLVSDLEAGSNEGAPVPVIPFRSLTGGRWCRRVQSPQRWWTARRFVCGMHVGY